MNTDPERTLPIHPEQTIPSPVHDDPAALHAAEAGVAAEWQVGDVILDLYEVRQLHEGGGMGVVYRVHHRGWNTDLAVKSPRRDYFQTGQQKENFSQECETWINLGLHPHIVSCYYVRALGGIPRVFAEYVEGGSLKDWIDSRKLYEGGPEPALQRMLDIAIQFAWGLHYAHEHEQKLIHQDVKPANVMLTPEGVAKVTDFGLAKARAAAGESFVAGAGRSIPVSSGGMTPAYCSPEQAAKEPLSRRTDIWSWGLSVLEMFAGEMFWSAGQAAAEALEFYGEQGPSDPAIPPMPDGVRQLLKRCLRKDPALRPKDMQTLAEAMAEAFGETFGQAYQRTQRSKTKALAASLNNRAVSLMDLGKEIEAENYWNQALGQDPTHLESIYNLSLFQWRQGCISDTDAIEKLLTLRNSTVPAWRVAFLAAQLHLERDDCSAAIKLLETLEPEEAHCSEVQSTFDLARRLQPTSLRLLQEAHYADREPPFSMSSDGRYMLSATNSNAVEIWELATCRVVQKFVGHTDSVRSAYLSADGCHVLSTSADDTLRLWDVSTGRCLRIVSEQCLSSFRVCLSNDSRIALSVGAGNLSLWDVSTGSLRGAYKSHWDPTTRDGELHSVCLRGNTALEIKGSHHSDTLELWDSVADVPMRKFRGLAVMRAACLCSTGQYAMSQSYGQEIRLWNTVSGCCMRTFYGPPLNEREIEESTYRLCLSADGRLATRIRYYEVPRPGENEVGFRNFVIMMTLRSTTGTDVHQRLARETGLVRGEVANSPSVRKSRGCVIELWDVAGNQPRYHAPAELCKLVTSTNALEREAKFQCYLRQATEMLAVGEVAQAARHLREARSVAECERRPEVLEKWFELYRTLPKTTLRGAWQCSQAHLGSPVELIAMDPQGRFVVSACNYDDGPVRISKAHVLAVEGMSIKRVLHTFAYGNKTLSTALCITPDGQRALFRRWDRLEHRHVVSGRLLRELLSPRDPLCFHPNGLFVFAGTGAETNKDGGRTLRFWDLESERCLRQFKGHDGKITSVCASADGRFVLTGSKDFSLKFWELATGNCLRSFRGHAGEVNSVCLSLEGRFVLSGSTDGTLRLWEAASGDCLRIMSGHGAEVNSVTLTGDSRFALSGSADTTLKIWRLEDGECVKTLDGHTGSVNMVGMSADGRLAVSCGDCSVRLWALDWELRDGKLADWDEGAQPHLIHFLIRQCLRAALPAEGPVSEDVLTAALTSTGSPTWNENDLASLCRELASAGFGYLKSDRIRIELARMVDAWKGPPPA